MMRNGLARLIAVLAAAFLAVTLLWPLALVIQGGFVADGHLTLRYLKGVFENPVYAEGLWNSVRLAAGTTALAMLLAVPLAWLAARVDFPGKSVLTGLLLVPMVLPPFVGAIGFQQMLGPYGALNAAFGLGPVDWLGPGSYWGVVLLQALGLYPVLYLNAVAALGNVDPSMDEAAENLGCHGAAKFFRITLPLIVPGLFAGGTLVFIWSFTELGTPLMLSYNRCAAVQVYDALKEIGSNPFPYALVVVMLSGSVALYAMSRLLLGRGGRLLQGRAGAARVLPRLAGLRAVAAALPFVVVIGVALIPHTGVILTSFSAPGAWYRSVLPAAWTLDHYAQALTHDVAVSSIGNSLVFSGLAVAFDVVLGLAVALVVVRSSVRFRAALDALVMIPLAVPGLVMAFGYLAVSAWLSNQGWVKEREALAGILDVRRNPAVFLVIAYAVRRLPYMVRSLCAGLQQTSPVFEEAAQSLGAGPMATVRRITLPLIAANIVAGAVLTFAFSMLEVSDSLMLAQRAENYPITKTIYELNQLLGTGRYVAAAMGVWAMLLLSVSLLAGSRLLGKRMGALFRV